METVLDRAVKMTETQLTKMRWALGLSGALSVALGVVIIAWPGISLYALTLVFGAYALATGIIQLASAISGGENGGRGWLVVSGLLGIAVGVVVLVWTNISALALLYVIGVYAIALGVIAIGGVFWLPLHADDAALMILTGVISILFGIVVFAMPGTGALVLLALIAAFALVVGISELAVAIGGKRIVEHDLKAMFGPKPQPSST
jgi:uncharacterized membrane protein HdeD (DUF308 family)